MIDQLLKRYPLISDQVDKKELAVILDQLEKVLKADITGAVLEFGCYSGTTSLFIQRVLQKLDPTRQFHVYDSFAGLPHKSPHDNSPAGLQFKAGELLASKAQFIKNFRAAGLGLPQIHKAWFNELEQDDIPKPIAFAFLDGDFYQSIHDSLKLIENNLSKNSIIVIDDYQSESLPGTALAVDNWAEDRGLNVIPHASLAIIKNY